MNREAEAKILESAINRIESGVSTYSCNAIVMAADYFPIGRRLKKEYFDYLSNKYDLYHNEKITNGVFSGWFLERNDLLDNNKLKAFRIKCLTDFKKIIRASK
jgi:hypothetical protein